MSFLITPDHLYTRIKNGEEIVLLDVRSNLHEPDQGKREYKRSHLPGAFYLHLEHDLSGEVKKHGGNHPLPNIDAFAKKLGEMGIHKEVTVVVYDDQNNMFAPRAWWLLYYLGHEKTYVLNGGYDAWVKAGYEVTAEVPETTPTVFVPEVKEDAVVSMEEVKNRDPHTTLIDSRARERYLGMVEPLYDKAGHIPGAKNYFWQEVLDEEGNWKNPEQLREHFQYIQPENTVIVSCGSGVSACPNILALKIIGFPHVKLYAGSYSDWISYEENEIETKEEE